MPKKYNSNLIKSYRSYSVSDVARLFKEQKLHEQTIRWWIKSGKLACFYDGRKALIYGAILKDYIMKNNDSLKKGNLGFKEIKCFKCQKINKPLDDCVYTKTNNLGCPQVFGVCPNCGNKFHKIFKKGSEENIQSVFIVDSERVLRLYDSFSSGEYTHLNNNSKEGLSECNEESDKNTFSSKGDAHMAGEQSELFSWL